LDKRLREAVVSNRVVEEERATRKGRESEESG